MSTTTPASAEDWAQIEAASRQEGRVLAYSTLRPDNWKPIIEAFNKRYPWIKVETLRVGSHNEAFERQRASLQGDVMLSFDKTDCFAFASGDGAASADTQDT